MKFFESHGHSLTVDKHKTAVSTEQDWLVIAFSTTTNDITHPAIQNRLLLESSETFNKWQQCPFSLTIPETSEEFERVIKVINFLKTEDGEDFSNGFGRVDSYDKILTAISYKKVGNIHE